NWPARLAATFMFRVGTGAALGGGWAGGTAGRAGVGSSWPGHTGTTGAHPRGTGRRVLVAKPWVRSSERRLVTGWRSTRWSGDWSGWREQEFQTCYAIPCIYHPHDHGGLRVRGSRSLTPSEAHNVGSQGGAVVVAHGGLVNRVGPCPRRAVGESAPWRRHRSRCWRAAPRRPRLP